MPYLPLQPLRRDASGVASYFLQTHDIRRAFSDIWAELYYPAVSLYKGATVSMNFGPTFKFPPEEDTNMRPVCDLAKPETVNMSACP